MSGGLVHSIFARFYERFFNENVALVLAALTALLLAALITFAAIRVCNIIFKKLVRTDEIHVRFMHSFVTFLCIIGGVLLAGIFFGYSKGLGRVLLGSTGLLIAIIGFAAQATIGDVIAGVMIGISRPFKLGDKITLEGTGISGTVRDMTIRHTVIHRFDGLYDIVPNSVINSSIVQNDSYRRELTGSYLEFGISYDSNIHTAIKIIHDCVIGCRHTVEYAGDNPEGRRAAVYMTGFGESAILLRTTIWARNADELFLAKSDIMIKVKEKFEEYGVEIPYNYINVVRRYPSEEKSAPVVAIEPDQIYEEESAEVLKSVGVFCRVNNISRKDSAHVRLLAEELMELMKDYRDSESYFNISMTDNNVCELHYKVRTSVSDSDKRMLQSLDTSGSDGSLSGIISRFMSGVIDGQWSMAQYREEVSRGEVSVDSISKSILASMADDINIKVKSGIVEIIICRSVSITD